MSEAAPDTETEELRRRLKRMKRNIRNAKAEGLMLGITSMLTEGDVVVDCGANQGVVTKLLAATGAHVHAFEPDPWCFEKLQELFAGTPNVTLHNAAVGTTAGKVRLSRADNFAENPEGASVKSTILAGARKMSDENAVEVDLIDFPAFLRDQIDGGASIAFVKLDIEGAELDLLEEMARGDLLDQIRLTVAETHEKKFRSLAPRFKALREMIGARYPQTKVNLDWI